MNILEVILKLSLAIALGGLVGLEREASQKPAGFRTNILVCVGSALMMILSELMLQGKTQNSGDSLRIGAAVITGMGFIGAGTIIQARGMVAGLTTASTLWVVSGLGLVVGAGYYLLGLVFTALVLLILISFRKIEDSYLKKTHNHYILKIRDHPDLLMNLKKLSLHLGLKLEEIHLKRDKEFSILSFSLSTLEEKEQKFNQSLLELGEVVELRIE